MKKFALFIFCLLCLNPLFAQSISKRKLPHALLISSINQPISEKLHASNSNIDKRYSYQFHQINVSYKLPIYQKGSMDHTLGKGVYLGLLPGIQLSRINFGDPQMNRTFVNIRLGLSGLFLLNQKSTVILGVNALANEDIYTIVQPYYRFTSIGLYRRRVSEKFSYLIGAAFTYNFGEPMLLPVIGSTFLTGKRSKLNVLLPFNIKWTKYSENYRRSFGIYTKTLGGFNRYQNKLGIDTSNYIYNLRRSSLQTGFFYGINTKNIRINFQLGIGSRQNIRFTNNESQVINGYKFTADPTLFFGVNLIIPIKKHERQEPIEEELLEESWMGL